MVPAQNSVLACPPHLVHLWQQSALILTLREHHLLDPAGRTMLLVVVFNVCVCVCVCVCMCVCDKLPSPCISVVGSERDDFGIRHGSCLKFIEHVLTLSILKPHPCLRVLGRVYQSRQQRESVRVGSLKKINNRNKSTDCVHFSIQFPPSVRQLSMWYL